MPTIHPIVDADERFTIDPISRKIENESGKITLIQYDHNSERYGFTIPRYVEGHDMSLSTLIEVHYNNASSSGGGVNHGLYEVTDMQVNPDNEDEVIFTWLVSNNATQLVGSLNFVIRFSCFDGSNLVYAWHTSIYNAIVIAPGIYNSDIIVEEYPDVLRQWEIEFGKAYTDIPANADLDSYTESGWYRCTSYEIAKTLTNSPVEAPFVMRIVCSTDNPVAGVSQYTKTRILYPHDAEGAIDKPNDPTVLSMQQVWVENANDTAGWFGRWYKSYEPAGLTVDENDPYKLYLTGRNITGVPKPFTDFGADISGAAKKSLNLNGTTLELQRPDGTVESSASLSSILPNYEWKERSSGISGDTTTRMRESVQTLMLYTRSRYVFTTTKDVYVKLWDMSDNVVWTSESIPANSKIYVDYDGASGIATIHAGTERHFMPFVSSFSFAGGYGPLSIGIETTDGTAFGKGNATVTESTYE